MRRVFIYPPHTLKNTLIFPEYIYAVSLLEEIREDLQILFSRIELEVLDYLSKHPWGVTISEIAKNIKRSSKTLYCILKILQKNGWVTVIKEKNGGIGRPRNKYILRRGIGTILSELKNCGCEVHSGNAKVLNLTEVTFPYSLTIFKRCLAKLKFGECLLVLLGDHTECKEFIEIADKKNVKLVKVVFEKSYVNIIFKKTWS